VIVHVDNPFAVPRALQQIDSLRRSCGDRFVILIVLAPSAADQAAHFDHYRPISGLALYRSTAEKRLVKIWSNPLLPLRPLATRV
jgi:hypothetical protein